MGQGGELTGAPRQALARRDIAGAGPHRHAAAERIDRVALERRRAQFDERRVEDALDE